MPERRVLAVAQEVEAVLCQHPAVAETGVIGIPDETWGEVVVAYVAKREGLSATEAELIEFAKEQIAAHKVPENANSRARPGIEPVTPEGQVYVTGPFAAQIVIAGGDRFSCKYDGEDPRGERFWFAVDICVEKENLKV